MWIPDHLDLFLRFLFYSLDCGLRDPVTDHDAGGFRLQEAGLAKRAG